jgi:hypothetical protein
MEATSEALQPLAALLCYRALKKDKRRVKVPGFETLTPEEQQPWLEEAAEVLALFDKLNLAVVPPVAAFALTEGERHDRLCQIIRDYLGSLTVWKKDLILQTDTIAELAWRILRDVR